MAEANNNNNGNQNANVQEEPAPEDGQIPDQAIEASAAQIRMIRRIANVITEGTCMECQQRTAVQVNLVGHSGRGGGGGFRGRGGYRGRGYRGYYRPY